MLGVSFRVMPMKPIFTPLPKFLIEYEGRIVLPVFFTTTLAARYLKSAPPNTPSGQEFWLLAPSPSSMHPPFCSR